MDATQLQQVLDAVFARFAGNAAPANAASSSLAHATLASSLDNRIAKFHYDTECGNTFDRWFNRFGVLIEEDGKELPEATKVRLLLGKLGDDEYNKYRDSISPTQPDQVKWGESLTKLKDLFAETRSLFVRRFECFQIRQKPSQDITSLVAHINAACENADLSLTKEQLKCIILVIALRDEHHDLRQKCLKMLEEAQKNGTQITLKQIEEELRTIQLVKDSALTLASPPVATHAIHTRPQQWRDPKGKPKQQPKRAHNANEQPTRPPNTNYGKASRGSPTHPCGSCGESDHWRTDCRFKDATCHKCQGQGHIAKACRRSSNQARNRGERSVHTVVVKSHCMGIGTAAGRWWRLMFIINGIKILMNIDTGAQATILTLKTWKKLGSPKLDKPDIETRNCNEVPFNIEGKFVCTVCQPNQAPKQLVAYVSSEINYDLFGLPWIEALEVIPREIMHPDIHPKAQPAPAEINAMAIPQPTHKISDLESLTKALQTDFSDVFGPGLGHCTKANAHLILKPDARPTFCKARPVPHGALNAVNEELDRLLQIGAIKPIEFSHWAAPILAVMKKSGKTRVCIDFSTGLNNSLELNRHPLPRPEDIYTAISGSVYFSNLDLRDAYLQMELDEESKHLCGINTHRGLFQCQRLPFGVKSAPSIFQHLMDQIVSGIPGAFAYLDDGIIASKTLDEHISSLYKLFKRIQEFGLKIQLEKCKFLQPELLFLGHVISAKGIRPDPGRSEAIRQMPPPHDLSTLRSFLGALNYYGRFIKSMREIREPLDQLLRKDVKWEWTDEQQSAFQKAKEIMLSDLLLTHFDPSLPIVVAADASKDGIGTTISHIFPDKTEKVIEHASCTLNDAQKNYSQIEKEALALVFAVQKFHRMLFGRKFTLLTDHKPLLAIFGSKKGIPIYAASRLQRWALIMSNYEFDIKYINTSSFGQADVLSRLIANYPRPEEDILIANICTETDCYINAILQTATDQLPITKAEISESTPNDEILRKISDHTKNGWPQKCTDSDLSPFFPKRKEILQIDGCLLYGKRVIVPTQLRERIIKALHMAHPGIVRMKALARQHVYWPGLDLEIERMVRQCEDCQSAQKSPPKAPLAPWTSCSRPFQRIHIDFAGPCSDGHSYLILIDSFSKWPEVYRMDRISTPATLQVLRSIVYRLGFPEEIVSDNGTQFHAAEFKEFCSEFGIKHTFTPPYHPQSNGQAERFVDTFKRAMKKCAKDGKFWAEKMLLAYRTTPNSALNGLSPDQLFFGRRLRTQLSLVHPKEEQAEVIDPAKIRKSQADYARKMARQFDQHHGSKSVEFLPKDPVLLLNFNRGKRFWLNGTIIEKVEKSPTYRVHVPALGRAVHRHANQMRHRYPLEEDGNNTVRIPPQAQEEQDRDPSPIREPSPQPAPIQRTQAKRRTSSPPLAPRRSQRQRKAPIRFSPNP